MWYRVERVIGPVFRYLNGCDREQWIMFFVGTLVVGYFCMRGFGSRKNY